MHKVRTLASHPEVSFLPYQLFIAPHPALRSGGVVDTHHWDPFLSGIASSSLWKTFVSVEVTSKGKWQGIHIVQTGGPGGRRHSDQGVLCPYSCPGADAWHLQWPPVLGSATHRTRVTGHRVTFTQAAPGLVNQQSKE